MQIGELSPQRKRGGWAWNFASQGWELGPLESAGGASFAIQSIAGERGPFQLSLALPRESPPPCLQQAQGLLEFKSAEAAACFAGEYLASGALEARERAEESGEIELLEEEGFDSFAFASRAPGELEKGFLEGPCEFGIDSAGLLYIRESFSGSLAARSWERIERAEYCL